MKYVWNYETRTLGYRKPLSDARGRSASTAATPTASSTSTSPTSATPASTATALPRAAAVAAPAPPATACSTTTTPGRSTAAPTSVNPMRVTAAHEFFHAIQFAYDVDEDLWFMEGTATWVEDEVYDDDQRQLPVPRLQPDPVPGSSADYTRRLPPTAPGSSSRSPPSASAAPIVRRIWESPTARSPPTRCRRSGPWSSAPDKLDRPCSPSSRSWNTLPPRQLPASGARYPRPSWPRPGP